MAKLAGCVAAFGVFLPICVSAIGGAIRKSPNRNFVLRWAAVSLALGLINGCGGGGGSSSPAPVAAPVTATALTTAQALTVGTPMTNFSPLAPSGGTLPYTYSITSGMLPAGLNFYNNTGVVSGTPTTVYLTANVRFQVQDATGMAAATTSAVTFTVGQASNYISATATTTAQSLTVGTSMTSFSPLTPSGGVAPYTYILRSGTLPVGLVLDSVTGAITGTPAIAQTSANVTFGVIDTNFAEASTTSTVSFSVAALPAGFLYEGGLTWMPVSQWIVRDWPGAASYCTNTAANGGINGTNGMYDWRLPRDTELVALYNAYPSNSSVLLGLGWTLGNIWTSTSSGIGYYYVVGFTVTPNNNALAPSNGLGLVTCVR